MLLNQVAHARTGDKGNIVTISLIEKKVTAARVATHFAELIEGPVERYSLPQLGALNFVLHRSLSHTVTRSLALDAHGKCLGSALLALDI
jgi:hypothetical protein